MNTYCLFIFGTFEDHDEIEFFCSEILTELTTVNKLKYVIENSKNIIVIFESGSEHSTISKDLLNIMVSDAIKFYFLYPLDTMITAHLPEQLKDFIFKPVIEPLSIKIEYIKSETPNLDLDDVLEKINKNGLDSLTVEEKKFLDNF
jgi:hypothetical protein